MSDTRDSNSTHSDTAEGAEAAVLTAPPPEPAPPKPRRNFPLLATLALLLVLALAAASGWVVLEAQRREAGLRERLAQLEAAAAREQDGVEQRRRQMQQLSEGLGQRLQGELRDGLAAVEPRLEQQAGQLRQLAERVGAAERRVQAQSEEIARFTAADREGWLLAEAEHLLRLASQRLVMSGDTATTQALLRSADGVLQQVDSAHLHPVRAAIAADLAALRALPERDIEGLYLRLSALQEQAQVLAMIHQPSVPEAAPVPSPSAPPQDWRERLRQGLDAALHKLSSYIVIRRRELPAQAVMEPQWENLVRQNLCMLLEQAQVALLSGNARLYGDSLQRSRHWVAQFFDVDSAGARSMDSEIARLAEQVVTVDLPDIAETLRVLDQVLVAGDDTVSEPAPAPESGS
ncbi:MAG: uroporphyrinogen-III C-methyltransferase [Parahaliea sp.]